MLLISGMQVTLARLRAVGLSMFPRLLLNVLSDVGPSSGTSCSNAWYRVMLTVASVATSAGLL